MRPFGNRGLLIDFGVQWRGMECFVPIGRKWSKIFALPLCEDSCILAFGDAFRALVFSVTFNVLLK